MNGIYLVVTTQNKKGDLAVAFRIYLMSSLPTLNNPLILSNL